MSKLGEFKNLYKIEGGEFQILHTNYEWYGKDKDGFIWNYIPTDVEDFTFPNSKTIVGKYNQILDYLKEEESADKEDFLQELHLDYCTRSLDKHNKLNYEITWEYPHHKRVTATIETVFKRYFRKWQKWSEQNRQRVSLLDVPPEAIESLIWGEPYPEGVITEPASGEQQRALYDLQQQHINQHHNFLTINQLEQQCIANEIPVTQLGQQLFLPLCPACMTRGLRSFGISKTGKVWTIQCSNNECNFWFNKKTKKYQLKKKHTAELFLSFGILTRDYLRFEEFFQID